MTDAHVEIPSRLCLYFLTESLQMIDGKRSWIRGFHFLTAHLMLVPGVRIVYSLLLSSILSYIPSCPVGLYKVHLLRTTA